MRCINLTYLILIFMWSSVKEQGGKKGPNNYASLFHQEERIKQQSSVSSEIEPARSLPVQDLKFDIPDHSFPLSTSHQASTIPNKWKLFKHLDSKTFEEIIPKPQALFCVFACFFLRKRELFFLQAVFGASTPKLGR